MEVGWIEGVDPVDRGEQVRPQQGRGVLIQSAALDEAGVHEHHIAARAVVPDVRHRLVPLLAEPAGVTVNHEGAGG